MTARSEPSISVILQMMRNKTKERDTVSTDICVLPNCLLNPSRLWSRSSRNCVYINQYSNADRLVVREVGVLDGTQCKVQIQYQESVVVDQVAKEYAISCPCLTERQS